MLVWEMLSAHPGVQGSPHNALVQCIEECYSCMQSCTSCADACLAEKDVESLRLCIRLCLDCADICAAAGAVATRQTGSNNQATLAILVTCAQACQTCALECERHAAHHQHCRISAEACLRCENACRDAIAAMSIDARPENMPAMEPAGASAGAWS